MEDYEIVICLAFGAGDGKLIEVMFGICEVNFMGSADAIVGGFEGRRRMVRFRGFGAGGGSEGFGVDGDELENRSFGGGWGYARPLYYYIIRIR